jgi:VanZ family protein
MFEYGVLGILIYLVLSKIPNRIGRVGTTIVLVASAAFTDEWNQARVPNRTSAIQDVGIDITGSLVAILLFLLVRKAIYSRINRTAVDSNLKGS